MDSRRTDNNAYWPNLRAGLALGTVLLATFVLTGHGLGATGFTTRLTAWLGLAAAPSWTSGNEYLGAMLGNGNVLSSWITWEVLGVFCGGLASALLAGRVRWQVEGGSDGRRVGRLVKALVGGILAGFGARISAGCTSGIGLSGSAVLGVTGFTFLAGFFVVGLIASRLTGGGVR